MANGKYLEAASEISRNAVGDTRSYRTHEREHTMRLMKSWIGWVVLAGLVLNAGRAEAAVNAGVLFLRIAAGARAAGMGESFVAIADDATATHWNPSGLGEYPLNSQWVEFRIPGYGQVRDAAVIKNGLPYEGANAFDLWIMTDQGLMVMGSTDRTATAQASDATAEGSANKPVAAGRAANFLILPTSGVSSVSAAIRRYATFLTEDEADNIAAGAAAHLMAISMDQLEPMLTRVNDAVPENYRDRSVLANVVRDFRAAYRQGRLDPDRVPDLRNALAAVPQSGPANAETLDRVRFTMERSVTGVFPQSVQVALADIFGHSIRALAGDGNHLYVATPSRLLAFDGSRWEAVSAPTDSGWVAESINCLDLTSGPRLWVGTNHGVLVRLTSDWKRYGTAEGLPSERVTRMAFSTSRSGWVMTDKGLAALNEDVFSPNFGAVTNVGDSVITVLRRFLDSEDEVYLASAVSQVLSVNGKGADYIPEAGSSLLIPYQLGIHGQVTAIALDDFQRLWVGTTLGAVRFSQGHFVSQGYTKFVATEATTAKALAEKQLGGRGTPDRIAHFARITTEYNNLDADGNIPAGRVVYTYRNPAAAPINCLASAGDQFLVATNAGQLQVKSGDWTRYYHRDLERDQVHALVSLGKDIWFVTNNRVVVYMEARREVTFMHANWLPTLAPDIYYEYLSYATHIEGWGTVGVSATFLSYGEISRTDERGKVQGLFHSFDGALSVSYGTRLSSSLAGGLSAKIIYSRLADQGAGAEIGSGSATAFAMDAGILYHTPWKRLTFGAALTNVGPKISYIDAQQADNLPSNLALGLAYKLVNSPYNRVTLVGEMNKELVSLGKGTGSELKQIIYNTGLEYQYGSVIALRTGYINDEDGQIKTVTFGAGLAYQRFQLDFAYIPSTKEGMPLANTLRVSLTGRF
ncbi:MAG: PorV/PorQ family protein [candidate division Zixibacteria bacterium]|nr:PorV/PorQ family protein [candidate division Zixibacteria bacterium]